MWDTGLARRPSGGHSGPSSSRNSAIRGRRHARTAGIHFSRSRARLPPLRRRGPNRACAELRAEPRPVSAGLGPRVAVAEARPQGGAGRCVGFGGHGPRRALASLLVWVAGPRGLKRPRAGVQEAAGSGTAGRARRGLGRPESRKTKGVAGGVRGSRGVAGAWLPGRSYEPRSHCAAQVPSAPTQPLRGALPVPAGPRRLLLWHRSEERGCQCARTCVV
ncbi:hypothetical protein NN561_002496 [Cricetulus griseus]